MIKSLIEVLKNGEIKKITLNGEKMVGYNLCYDKYIELLDDFKIFKLDEVKNLRKENNIIEIITNEKFKRVSITSGVYKFRLEKSSTIIIELL